MASDVFISYASADRPRAAALARALQERGWSVWWDREILLGETYDAAINRALEGARCVVVLWSITAVQSDWVREEATRGRERGVLIPVLIDAAPIPLDFALLHTAQLVGWRFGSPHSGFDQLLVDIAQRLAPGTGPNSSGKSAIKLPLRRLTIRALPWALPALAIGAAALLLAALRIPTRVQLNLTVDRTVFKLGGTRETPILEPVGFRSLAIERFKSFAFDPQRLQVAKPRKYQEHKGGFPPDAWTSVRASPVVFTGTNPELPPSVTIDSLDTTSSVTGKLNLLVANPGTTITFETTWRRTPEILIKTDGRPLTITITPRNEFNLTTNYAAAAELVSLPFSSLTYLVRLRPSSPQIQVESAAPVLVMKMTLADASISDLLPKGGTQITEIDFIRLGAGGHWEPTLVAPGSIAYPDYPKKDSVTIMPDEFVGLVPLSQLSITQFALDKESKGIRLRLDGVASKVVTRSGEFTRDHRLTRLEAFRLNSTVGFMVTLVSGLASLTWSAYQAYKEIRSEHSPFGRS